MARKRQDTPLPKAPGTKVVKQTVPVTRMDKLLGRDPNHEQTRAEREAGIQRLIVLALLGAGIIIAVLLLIAFVSDGIIRPNQTVATINDQTVSVGEYQKRVRIERGIHIMLINDILNDLTEGSGISVEEAGNFILQQEPYLSWWNELNTPDVLGLRVLDDIIDDRLIASAAAEMGVSVSDADVDAYINKLIGYDPAAVALIGTEPTSTPEPTVTPTPFVSPTPTTEPTATVEPTATATVEGATAVPEATATSTPAPTEAPATPSVEEVTRSYERQKSSFVSEIANMAGASESEVRDVLKARALRSAIAAKLAAEGDDSEETDNTTLYADVRHILVTDENVAFDIVEALNAGESFADLARSASTDTGSGANGGDLGWAPVSNYVEPFANAVRDAEIGAIVGPVESDFGYHVLQVRAKEFREASQTQIDRANDLIFSAWLDGVRDAAEGTYSTTSAWASNIPSSPLWRLITR